MRKQLYWLSDGEWKRLEPLLPRGRRGAHRVDDRRVISGIIGPYTTIYNRFNRWSRQGIWFEMFEALTGSTGLIGTVAIDSTHIKAHRSAAGGKGGPFAKPSAARAAGERRKSTP
jgi:transposase